jgi:hypothetical protein
MIRWKKGEGRREKGEGRREKEEEDRHAGDFPFCPNHYHDECLIWQRAGDIVRVIVTFRSNLEV